MTSNSRVSALPSRISRCAFLVLAVAWSALACAGAAKAQTWNEVGDAGSIPALAQTTAGLGNLTRINGTLSADTDVDLYCIQVNNRAAFSAGLNCLIQLSADLYLFDGLGKGIAVAQVCAAGNKAITSILLPSAGLYYLGVAPHGAMAFAGPNAIWLAGSTSQRAPDGPGAAGSVNSWGGTPVVQPGFSSYGVDITGAVFCNAVTPAGSPSWGRVRNIYR
jgi:hypothetical protein